MNRNIIKIAQVVSVTDDAAGLRIKAALPQEENKSVEELPYAFPLLPKTIQSVPKVGEGVLIITMDADNKNSDRFYLGPIISQPQYQEKCTHSYGRGPSMALLNEKYGKVLESILNYSDTTLGAFPNINDVALVGRQGNDVILRQTPGRESEEVNIRCGIRRDGANGNPNLVGKVIFNNINPAYIQLKYGVNIAQGNDKYGNDLQTNSAVNIVADRVNIASTKDLTLNSEITNPETLIPEVDSLMNDLHQVPLGDKLVDFLEKFKTAFLNHTHKHALRTPCEGTLGLKEFNDYTIRDILSEYVRIS